MEPSVLNMVLYLYEHYLDDPGEPPPRAALENALRAGGVPAPKAAQALDWLESLAASPPPPASPRGNAQRAYNAFERSRLSAEARGFLLRLERTGVIEPAERELAIGRALALDEAEVDAEAMKWVVLLTLFYLPDRESAFAQMEDICYPHLDPVEH